MTEVEGLIRRTLERARELGFLGPGPVEAHIDHAAAFGRVIEAAADETPALVGDLGSGGGVPALVLAARWPDTRFSLFESMARRAEFLRDAVRTAQWGDRVAVLEGRAEDLAHDPTYRGTFDVVTARGFAGPAATAEIGTALVRLDGLLVVSDPPTADAKRWPENRLHELGLSAAVRVTDSLNGAHFAVLRRIGGIDERLPRQRALPTRRPRW